MKTLFSMTCLIIATTTAITLIGCGSARRGEPITTPVKLSDSKAQLGERVYAINCYQCHPGGATGLAPALNNKPLPKGLIKLQVRQGLGEMPGFSKQRVTDDELDALAQYVALLRKAR
jgi:mono/diheme cytochrome c family protein